MLIMCSPQFGFQDDLGFGNGIEPILQWRLASIEQDLEFAEPWTSELNSETRNVLHHLRFIFGQDNSQGESIIHSILSTDDLHDLTCYVLHRLLSPPSGSIWPLSECLRYAMSIYMLIIHGPTYYSHVHFLGTLTLHLRHHLEVLATSAYSHNAASLWCLTIGMMSSGGTIENEWFLSQATELSHNLGVQSWDDVQPCLRSVLWDKCRSAAMFRQAWEQIVLRSSCVLMNAT